MGERSEAKKTAALWVAQGRGAADIAASLTPAPALRTVQNWLGEPEFKEQVEVHRGRMVQSAAVGMGMILLDMPDLVKDGLEIAHTPDHKHQADMIKYMVDKVLVPKSQQEVTEHRVVDIRVLNELSEGLREVREVRGVRVLPKLLEGKVAAESYGTPVGEDSKDG